MNKTKSFVKYLKNISNLINSLLEKNLNKLNFKNLNNLLKNNKFILSFVAIIVIFISYLLTPTFYKEIDISKKLQNSYKLLDLDINSSLDEIKGKYKVLAKKWHPDVQKKEEAEYNQNKFIDITNAYKAILKSFTETKK